jgi:TatD DNase family protein
MIDTHAHLRQNEDLKIVGLKAVILSSGDLEDARENLILAKSNPILYPAAGIHPQALDPENIDKNINELDKMVQNYKNIIAVGECGLEFTDGVDKKSQERLFRGQIAVALKHKKPLIIHSRKASDETLEILGSYKNLRGVIHCYTGGKKRIQKVLDLPGEWYFGIDGNLTYEDGLVEVVNNIPKDRLLLETDCPALTPVPHRGETNYPEYVKFVYEKVAEIWKMSFEETEKVVDRNAERLFQII